MSLLLDSHPTDIYNTFRKLLPQEESIFLVGYYFFNNNKLINKPESFRKYTIAGQQLLTFSINNDLRYKEYNFADENTELTIDDFYSIYDEVNTAINKKYKVSNEISGIDLINEKLDELNKNLTINIILNIVNEEQIIPKKNIDHSPNSYSSISVSTKKSKKINSSKDLKGINLSEFKKSISNFSYKPLNKPNSKNNKINSLRILDFNDKKNKPILATINTRTKKLKKSKLYDHIIINKKYMNLSEDEMILNINNLSSYFLSDRGIISIHFNYDTTTNINDDKKGLLSYNEESLIKLIRSNRLINLRIKSFSKINFTSVNFQNSVVLSVILEKGSYNRFLSNDTTLIPTSIIKPKQCTIQISLEKEINGVSKQALNILMDKKYIQLFQYSSQNITQNVTTYKKDNFLLEKMIFLIYRNILKIPRNKKVTKNYWNIKFEDYYGNIYVGSGNINKEPTDSEISLTEYLQKELNDQQIWGFVLPLSD